MPERVRITDVSPRDGLQNEPGIIPTPDKARLVELLSRTGVDEIEVTSFVSPKWIPQLGDGAAVLALLPLPPGGGWGVGDLPTASLPPLPPLPTRQPSTQDHPIFSALVPNERGLQSLLEVNRRAGSRLVQKASVFTAASETFCLKNTNASFAETLDRFRPVIHAAHAENLTVRGYLSCVIACPFEGPIPPEKVVESALALVELGVDEIDLGDTIGAGDPTTIDRLLKQWGSAFPIDNPRVPTTLHLHDTFGRAADCVKAALDRGVRSFDGSVAGLGGCPYASTPGNRAPGNIDTALLVRTIHNAGYETGVNLDKLEEAARFARRIVADARAADPAEGRTP